MMNKLQKILEEQINEKLSRIILSGARGEDGPSKVKIRPVLLREELVYQVSETKGKQEFHRNYSKEKVMAYIMDNLEQQFKQLQLEGGTLDATALISKKGKVTVRTKNHPPRMCQKSLSHNRTKQYILQEDIPVPFLIDLGVMTENGKVVKSRYDKFRQINRFLEFIRDVLPELPKDREVNILDFGCGKSYLTFAMYYYLHELEGYQVRIMGLDLKKDVIAYCRKLARKYGYDKLDFQMGDIASYEDTKGIDMVVTLHACDIATDYALEKAVKWGAKVILSVPCCQHEVNGQISNELMSSVFSYGILKERMAALMTDGIRAELLKEQGYEVQILEFIDMEHTPKNLLIRGVKTGKKEHNTQLDKMLEAFHITPTLAGLLREQEDTVEENHC